MCQKTFPCQMDSQDPDSEKSDVSADVSFGQLEKNVLNL
jgi:hypothetical protein